MEIVDRVRQIAQGYADQRDIEIIDIIYRREQPGMVLRIVADTTAGITIAECEGISKFLSEELDKEDVIQDHYTLEVSSPGLDRPIKTDRDFQRAMGKLIEVMTYEPIDGKKARDGSLIGMDKETIVVESDGISTVIPRNKIALARLKLEF
jgi:ribosome maturation factor RimP